MISFSSFVLGSGYVIKKVMELEKGHSPAECAALVQRQPRTPFLRTRIHGTSARVLPGSESSSNGCTAIRFQPSLLAIGYHRIVWPLRGFLTSCKCPSIPSELSRPFSPFHDMSTSSFTTESRQPLKNQVLDFFCHSSIFRCSFLFKGKCSLTLVSSFYLIRVPPICTNSFSFLIHRQPDLSFACSENHCSLICQKEALPKTMALLF
jgi:hypothetical protein